MLPQMPLPASNADAESVAAPFCLRYKRIAALTTAALQLALVLAGDDETAEIIGPGGDKADDGAYHFRLAFDLQPGVVALAGQITAIQPLGDDALQILAHGLGEVGRALARNPVRKLKVGVAHRLDQLGEPDTALAQRAVHPRF